MEFKRFLAGMVMAAATAGFGCGGDMGDVAASGDQSADDVSSSTAWGHLAGAWTADSGTIHELVLTYTSEGHGHHFFASYDNGIRCVRAPCPSESTAEGVYAATSRTLTLSPSDPRLGVAVAPFGAYQYALRGTTLTLSRSGREVGRLHRVDSYCNEPADCAEQGLVHPACAPGAWTCSATHACGFRCGSTGQAYGQTCGGIAALHCAAGLTCINPPGPSYPDEAGTCGIVAGEGGRCGGFTPTPAVCAAGLHCVANHIPDVPGTCVRDVAVTMCTEVRCTATTHCEDTPTGAHCVANTDACATVRCRAGTHCVAADTGATCEIDPGACLADSDCNLHDNYCGGCACDALGHNQRPVTCTNPVMCLRQPCGGLAATCNTGTHRCEAAGAGPRCGTATCAAGQVCCNPLMGICTPPGGVCIQ